MSSNDCMKNSMAIAAAACISILLMQDPGVLFYTGILGVSLLVLTAIISPWLGLLALFPLAFALRPAPPSVGAQEISFAALLAVIFIAALIKLLRTCGIRSVLRLFGIPLLIGAGILSINLAVAMHNHVPMLDWIRGVIPFLFIYALIPVCALVSGDESKIRWVGASVGTLIFLTAGYIVFYYFYHDMWQPYWLILTNGEEVKISQEAALNNVNAMGPMRDRITMLLAQATDALLPVGMVVGFVVSTLARDRRITIVGALVAMLCMAAVLITFTRSMLISALLVMLLFSLYAFFAHKNLRVKLSANLATQGVFGVAFIFSTGMDQVWLGRLSLLSGAAWKRKGDFNVMSRLEEYKIAWEMFLSHPVLGNGMGIKHGMRWETSEGVSFTEMVAYIHNWPLYMLMVGGLLGFLVYSLVIAGPVLYRLTSLRSESAHLTVVRAAVMTLAVYGLFFAVFRLISFNLLLAAAWGVVFAHKWSRENRASSAHAVHSHTASTQTKEKPVGHEPADQKNVELSV